MLLDHSIPPVQSKPDGNLQFPSDFAKRQTTFHISGQLYGNPSGNLKSRLTFSNRSASGLRPAGRLKQPYEWLAACDAVPLSGRSSTSIDPVSMQLVRSGGPIVTCFLSSN